jgi:hypothetical protein
MPGVGERGMGQRPGQTGEVLAAANPAVPAPALTC